MAWFSQCTTARNTEALSKVSLLSCHATTRWRCHQHRYDIRPAIRFCGCVRDLLVALARLALNSIASCFRILLRCYFYNSSDYVWNPNRLSPVVSPTCKSMQCFARGRGARFHDQIWNEEPTRLDTTIQPSASKTKASESEVRKNRLYMAFRSTDNCLFFFWFNKKIVPV